LTAGELYRRATFRLLDGVRRGLGQTSPVPWVWCGRRGGGAARRRPPLSPPVLVLSMPRSGSSWVGETLGRAPTALYLREPLTQSRPPEEASRDTVFAVSDALPPPAFYAQAADDAFAGLPRFPRSIVITPRDWSLRRRTRGRLVVKEVNPLACGWLVADYRPRVILLVRHPLAIAHSYLRLGWIGADPASWLDLGRRMSSAMSHALSALEAAGEHRVVAYETLCADPIGQFEALFEFAGLPWTETLADHVRANTAPGPSPERARSATSSEAVEQLRAGYMSRSLAWYQSDADW
jgi:hypothetical protein